MYKSSDQSEPSKHLGTGYWQSCKRRRVKNNKEASKCVPAKERDCLTLMCSAVQCSAVQCSGSIDVGELQITSALSLALVFYCSSSSRSSASCLFTCIVTTRNSNASGFDDTVTNTCMYCPAFNSSVINVQFYCLTVLSVIGYLRYFCCQCLPVRCLNCWLDWASSAHQLHFWAITCFDTLECVWFSWLVTSIFSLF